MKNTMQATEDPLYVAHWDSSSVLVIVSLRLVEKWHSPNASECVMKLPRKTDPTTKPTNSTQSSSFIKPIWNNNKSINPENSSPSSIVIRPILNKKQYMLALQIVHQTESLYDLSEITNTKPLAYIKLNLMVLVMVFNATINNIQLYRYDQFYWWRKPEYPVKNQRPAASHWVHPRHEWDSTSQL